MLQLSWGREKQAQRPRAASACLRGRAEIVSYSIYLLRFKYDEIGALDFFQEGFNTDCLYGQQLLWRMNDWHVSLSPQIGNQLLGNNKTLGNEHLTSARLCADHNCLYHRYGHNLSFTWTSVSWHKSQSAAACEWTCIYRFLPPAPVTSSILSGPAGYIVGEVDRNLFVSFFKLTRYRVCFGTVVTLL